MTLNPNPHVDSLAAEQVAVDTETLRRWYEEERLTLAIISKRLRLSEGQTRTLLRERGLQRRPGGRPLRCDCGVLMNAHPRCKRCGYLVHPANPDPKRGYLCSFCKEELTRVMRQAAVRRKASRR